MDEKRLSRMEERIEKIALELEKAKIAEYVEIMNNPRKLLYTNFIGGLARGLGTAIGLTALAAILFYILRQTVNLPLIGRYIADLLDIIENYR
ncbi:DUF5665 domain-containing protein [Thermotalea metallivorans]|uniref:Uncharacterized protein n=1 Tax=Thermotalea metallivorans TaxID=520762 RepID=A0A140L5Z5_9FIRM|nr:DUF5665 domain-containing protein [Thermotalea metallivorans]KXG75970.1 hypothetical protein AN619_14340 [Thermotalea metallivorans]